jgi:HAD superfamily hydrolase (TIGR01509 family)
MSLTQHISSLGPARPDMHVGSPQVTTLLRARAPIMVSPGMAASCREAGARTGPSTRHALTAGILDVDGVLLASPHERAWREALAGFAEPARFTTAIYQARVAGRPRLDGAYAALAALGVPNAERQAELYSERKQARLEKLIKAGCVTAYPDALRFLRAIRALGWKVAAASSSKNANPMMHLVHFDLDHMLLDAFDANVCGRDLARGKPAPDIFLLAAFELATEPAHCFVVEDAPAGIEAARAAGMTAIGVARHDDAAGLWAAGADLVVTSLDDIAVGKLAEGMLCLN